MFNKPPTAGDAVYRFTLSLIVLWLIPLCPAFSNDPLRPMRTTDPPVIDGKLDDPAWKIAPSVGGFKTFIPYFGREVKEQTVVYMLYDAENLYFAFDCYDPEPHKIKTSLAERDKMRADDWICVNLDSFNDQQALYCLYVNPNGIQGDSKFAAGTEDMSVDAVWYSAGAMKDSGYTIEMRVPLKSIRYPDKNPTTMSVLFERYVSRSTEHSGYPHLSPEKGYAFLTQMIPMVYEDLQHYTLFELLPAVTYSHRSANSQGVLGTTEKRGDLSLTTKYGITSDLILDATYNPDFSQVESDAGQVDVNLRSQLFLAEKRPFFLEGQEIFTMASSDNSQLDPLISVVHTRTIVDPLAGFKLSGKLGEGNTLSALYSMDDLAGDPSGRWAHVPVLRYKRALTGDSFIGGIAASRELRTGANRAGGVDAQIRVGESSMLEGQGLLSQSDIPDGGSRGSGHSVGLRLWYDTQSLDYNLAFREISDNFRLDMGFLTRTGVIDGAFRIRPKIYPESGMFRRIDMEAFTGQTKDRPSGLWETSNYAAVYGYFRNALNLRFQYSYSTEIFLSQRFRTGSFLASGGGLLTNWLSVNISYRRGNAIFFSASPYQGRNTNLTASATLQPSDQFRGDLSFVYVTFHRESDSQRIFEYPISRAKLTYQMNQYLFFRGIFEYNKFRKQLLTDFLASFTYIPGTVAYLGYGSIYKKTRWDNGAYIDDPDFLEMQRGIFFKMSYLWRS